MTSEKLGQMTHEVLPSIVSKLTSMAWRSKCVSCNLSCPIKTLCICDR